MPKKPKSPKEINIDQILLHKRTIHLNGKVDDASILPLIKKIQALDCLSKKPIYLWINSGGGSVYAGFALMNVMKRVKSKIITIINSEACSMGSQISICGDERWCVMNLL